MSFMIRGCMCMICFGMQWGEFDRPPVGRIFADFYMCIMRYFDTSPLSLSLNLKLNSPQSFEQLPQGEHSRELRFQTHQTKIPLKLKLKLKLSLILLYSSPHRNVYRTPPLNRINTAISTSFINKELNSM